MHLELNLSEIQLGSNTLIIIKIELEINDMQIGGKGIENNIKTQIQKNIFPCLFIWKWIKHILNKNLVGWNILRPYNHPT